MEEGYSKNAPFSIEDLMHNNPVMNNTQTRKATWTMTGVSVVVKGKTMKIFINERCYVPFQLRGNMKMRLVKFKKCFIMDIIRIYMIKTKGLQKCSNSDILWTASIGWRLITGNGRGLQTASHINNRPFAPAATGSKSSIYEPLLYGNTSRHLRPTVK
ncbi:hypothetical protein KY289_032490 [Solanum tuberosum]|nr:hypothetical protein KY289_032490 [Solanum tuberosum]